MALQARAKIAASGWRFLRLCRKSGISANTLLPCDQATSRRPQSSATQSRSPGVSSAAFRAQSPDLRFASLMAMDFAVSCPLVRCWRLFSGFCPSTRTFAPRCLQTSPRGDSPCGLANPSPPSGWEEDLHLQATEHAQHTTRPLAHHRGSRGLRTPLPPRWSTCV
jgi:hypothetical protein